MGVFVEHAQKFETSGQRGEAMMDTRRSKRVLGQPTIHASSKAKLNLDANSERNAVFYSQEGAVNEYPKTDVYPREGGEVQLEQLRARLPKYCPPCEFGDSMEMSMELTMACATNITIMPGLLDKGSQDKENTSALPRQGKSFGSRQPLQPMAVATFPSGPTQSSSPDEKLAWLCQEMGGGVRRGGDGRRGRVREVEEDSGEAISELLDDMMLQQSAERQMERQKNNSAAVVADVAVKVTVAPRNPPQDLENLVNQENCQPPPCVQSNVSGRGCVTRLNFSDAESSLGTSQLNSFMEDSVGGRGSVLAHSQVRVHEQSGAGGQSFEIFHDSWRNQSHNASYSRPDKLQPTARQKSHLDKKGGPEARSLAESYQSYDQSQSFQTGISRSNMSSFSVYEDTAAEQSSFVPFHDSWANSSRDAGAGSSRVGGGGGGGGGATGAVDHPAMPERVLRPVSAESGQEREGGAVYHAALGVPLEGGGGHRIGGGGGGVNSSIVDQSFTQAGISHPKIAPSISTPVGKNIDFTFDMSRIQSETEFLPPPHHHHQHQQQQQQQQSQEMEGPGVGAGVAAAMGPLRKRSCILGAMNLSTIREESSSFKSSRSSASSTTTGSSSSSSSSSSGSSVSHESLAGSPPEVNVNPFSSEIVNMMLNAMSPSVVEAVCRVPGCLPQLGNGRTAMLGHREFTGLRKITSGGFGTIYSCKDQTDSKVLKVQKPAMLWEMAIISELHTRLKASDLLVQSFVNAEQTFMFNDASVMVLPRYQHGSLLDVANAHGASLNDLFQFFYAGEVLEIVASLHHCGVLHTDLKPDNFMLTDLSCHKSFGSAVGNGLVLIDFGRAVDLRVFPGEAMFQGSSDTDGFQCIQMLEGRPWKYEADYFGIAATVHVLLTGEYMSLQKNPESGLYQTSKAFRRPQRNLWNRFFGCLLNTTQPLPLAEMAAEMRTKLDGIKDYVFQAFSKKMLTAVHKTLSQGT